jgi:hypothetical protein
MAWFASNPNIFPLAHMTIVRTILVVASIHNWSVSRLDVQNAFLNGELRKEVYMQYPLIPLQRIYNFDAPCLFLHHLPNVSLHFVALLCIFRN